MKKEKIIAILEKLEKDNILFSKEDLQLDENEYAIILDIVTKSRLVDGISIDRVGMEGKYLIHVNNAQITLSGIEYLYHNLKNISWKYKVDIIESNDIDNKLNDIAKEGWELVNFIPIYEGVSNVHYTEPESLKDIRISCYKAIFKMIDNQ